MIYRVTFGFSGMGTGWAETHACLSGLNSPRDLGPTMNDIAAKRVQMLGREFSIVAVRIARYATDAGVRQRGVYLSKTLFTNSVTTASAAAEPASVALLIRGSALISLINPQFNANQNQTFLGAPLDVCVDNAGVVYAGKGGLGAAFASWRSAMIAANMGWLVSDTIVDAGTSNWLQNPNGTVSFKVDVANFPPLVIGQWYKARVRGVNGGASPLNSEVIVQAGAEGTLTTREVIGLGLAQAGGFIRVYRQVSPFVSYGDLQLGELVGKHKRGRPFGSSPGRARKRIRG